MTMVFTCFVTFSILHDVFLSSSVMKVLSILEALFPFLSNSLLLTLSVTPESRLLEFSSHSRVMLIMHETLFFAQKLHYSLCLCVTLLSDLRVTLYLDNVLQLTILCAKSINMRYSIDLKKRKSRLNLDSRILSQEGMKEKIKSQKSVFARQDSCDKK